MFVTLYQTEISDPVLKSIAKLNSRNKTRKMIFRSLRWIWAFLTTCSLLADSDKKAQNIIVCVSENHAAGLLGSLDKFGSSLDPTPNLSKIAQTGFSHPKAYCTNSSPGHSAFSLLTGLPKDTDLRDFDPTTSLAKHFQSQGYKTAYFGSWSWDNKPDHFGFDQWYTLADAEIFFNPKIKDAKTNQVFEGHSTDIITDLAIRWVRKAHDTGKPFFIILSFNSMNRPWIPPVRMVNKYNEEWFTVPENFFTDFEERTPANKYQCMNIAQDLDPMSDLFLESMTDINQTLNQVSVLTKNLDSMNDEQKSAWMLSWKAQNEAFSRESLTEESSAIWKFQRYLKNYLRCLLAMDENIGRLFQFTKSQNKENNQFIYTSERGRFTGEFGWFGSEWMYEPSTRIPFIYTDDNTNSILQISSDAIWLDRDLYKLLKNNSVLGTESLSPKDEFYFSHHKFEQNNRVSPHQGLRKGRYKIIQYYPYDEWEFYDLLSDPMENRNLYHSHSHKDTIEHYKKLLQEACESQELSSPKFEFSEIWKRDQRSPNKKTR